MASARKKLDEKNLKVLRELVSLPENKHCFDCHQRGPTYVNVTIGSFVCTSCSGILRGLTPPHRVKSISMATFTSEEIDLLKSRGNEYCQKVWLGLHDGDQLSKDEQQIKDMMIAKYEKKRYYVKPSEAGKISNSSVLSSTYSSNSQNVPKLATSSFSFPAQNMNNNVNRNHNNNLFASQNFSSKTKEVPKMRVQPAHDPFSSLNSSVSSEPPAPVIDNFANFDNNPIFSTSQPFPSSVPVAPLDNKSQGPPPPSEDRYAALKDLDSLMKSQQSASQPETTVATTNSDWDPGSLWTSTMNGQTTQMPNIPNLFEVTPQALGNSNTKDFNPFVTNNSDAVWGNAFGGNPFNADFTWTATNGPSNGLPVNQSLSFNSAKPLWNFVTTPNPFSVSTNGQSVSHHSSNPFL